MSRIGVNLNIDVSKIDKSRIKEGKKGKYLDMTVFIDPKNPNEHGNHGLIFHKTDKGEDGKHLPLLGSARVFWTGESSPNKNQGNSQPNPNFDDFDDDIPF